jgi:hypothetical protein
VEIGREAKPESDFPSQRLQLRSTREANSFSNLRNLSSGWVVTCDGPVTVQVNGEDVHLIPIRNAHTDGDTSSVATFTWA